MIRRDFTTEQDGISARVIVTTGTEVYRADVVVYTDESTAKVSLLALRDTQSLTARYPGSLRDMEPTTAQIQAMTHGVDITSEYQMSLVAMRWMGVAS